MQFPPNPAAVSLGQPLLPLVFYKGRTGGDQVSYNGYAYTYDRTLKQGSMYWQCLHRIQCRPKCKSRLTTLDQNVIREQPHCHGPEIRDVHKAYVISRLKSNRSHRSAAAVDVKMALPNPLNLRQQILRACRKDLGPQPPPATSARAYMRLLILLFFFVTIDPLRGHPPCRREPWLSFN